MTVFLLDVNVLIALVDPARMQQDYAHDLVRQCRQTRFCHLSHH